jgi:hypothetical protein
MERGALPIRMAEIFKTPPFIYSIFLKTIPIHIIISIENPDPIINFITIL